MNQEASSKRNATVSADDAAPWVRVIIVNYNGGQLIQQCVDAVAGQTFSRYEVIVVDNASSDGSADALRLPDDRFRLLRSTTNLGFAGGCNLGARDAETGWLAMLNPDAVPQPDWLEQLFQATQRYPGISLFGSKQIMAATPALLDGYGDVYSIYGIPWRGGYGWPVETCPATDCAVFSPCAAAALYRRELFVELEGYDEDFFCYLEDVDFGFRALLRGHSCIQLQHAVVHHYGSGITGLNSDFAVFHSYRNRTWLLLKDVPFLLLILMAPLYVCAMTYLYIRTRSLQSWTIQWQGFWAARSGLRQIWRKRRDVQQQRVISVLQLARCLKWAPRTLRRRDYGCLNSRLAIQPAAAVNDAPDQRETVLRQ